MIEPLILSTKEGFTLTVTTQGKTFTFAEKKTADECLNLFRDFVDCFIRKSENTVTYAFGTKSHVTCDVCTHEFEAQLSEGQQTVKCPNCKQQAYI